MQRNVFWALLFSLITSGITLFCGSTTCWDVANELFCKVYNDDQESVCSTLESCITECKIGSDCCCTDQPMWDYYRCMDLWPDEYNTRFMMTKCIGGGNKSCASTKTYKSYCAIYIDNQKPRGASTCFNDRKVCLKSVGNGCCCETLNCNKNMLVCRSGNITCGSGNKTGVGYSMRTKCINRDDVACLITKDNGSQCQSLENCAKKCPPYSEACCCTPDSSIMTVTHSCTATWTRSLFSQMFITCFKGEEQIRYSYHAGFRVYCGVTKEGQKLGGFMMLNKCFRAVKRFGCCCDDDLCNENYDQCNLSNEPRRITYGLTWRDEQSSATGIAPLFSIGHVLVFLLNVFIYSR